MAQKNDIQKLIIIVWYLYKNWFTKICVLKPSKRQIRIILQTTNLTFSFYFTHSLR